MRNPLFIVLGLVVCAGVQAQQNCQDNIHDTTPTAEFTFHGDGTVTHQRTGLMWKQCLEGQTGVNCEGTASTFNWSTALQHARTTHFAGRGDWRVPNIRELRSIVETRCADPAINLEVFPASPGDLPIWSSSHDTSAPLNRNGWIVNYFWGQSFLNGIYSEFGVRLVRGGLESMPVDTPPGSVELCNAIPDGPHPFYLEDGREIVVPSGQCLAPPLDTPSIGMSIWECIWNDETNEYDCAFENYTIERECTYEVVKDWPPSCCPLSVHELGCIGNE